MEHPITRQEQHGVIGEYLVSVLLLSGPFFVAKRIPDVDGCDYLVQIAARTIAELRKRSTRIEVLGVAQSKFFEGKNDVRIQSHYVTDTDDKPRSEFFLFLHSEGGRRRWLFTAEEIVRLLRKQNYDGKPYYVFSLAKDRDFSVQEFRTDNQIFEIILE